MNYMQEPTRWLEGVVWLGIIIGIVYECIKEIRGKS